MLSSTDSILSSHAALLPLSLDEAASILVLTTARRAGAFHAQMPGATVLTDAASVEPMDERFDAALVDGVLENERWDRWLLQRVHGALRMGAPILVVVPALGSVASAVDAPFLAYAGRKVLVRMLQHWNADFELPGPVHRRYGLTRLVRTMESLGYTAIESMSQRPGGAGFGTPAWLSGRLALMARKTSSLPGVRGRGWPDAQLHRAQYAQKYASILAAREAWLSIFPEFRGCTARPLDPTEWRDARVLVLSPHPDDELIGCGGTLCRLIAAGGRVSILQATDGSRLRSLRDLPEARRKSVRLDESRRVAEAMGAELVLWRKQDSQLHCTDGTVTELARLLVDWRPTHVFTPFLGDPHGDHRTLSLIFAGAVETANLQPQVLQYEVWSLVPANLHCEITGQAATLEKLLLLYERAMRADDFVHFYESRALARALELTGRPGYVEAFLATSSAKYRRLAERTPAM
jgi:LmbE family N-acetylglucosaminyl deacetylase